MGDTIAKRGAVQLGGLIPTGSEREDRRTFCGTIAEQNKTAKIAKTRMDIGSPNRANLSTDGSRLWRWRNSSNSNLI
jgi:hypothetical protein